MIVWGFFAIISQVFYRCHNMFMDGKGWARGWGKGPWMAAEVGHGARWEGVRDTLRERRRHGEYL
jgi:hypothetical protein